MTDKRFYYLSADGHGRGSALGRGGYADRKIISECPACKHRVTEPTGTISVHVEPEKGRFWPDLLEASGGFMGLYFLTRVKDVFDSEAVRYGSAFQAEVAEPIPKGLMHLTPPTYFYITGELGAKLDFEASGYRVESICSSCGAIKSDPSSEPTKLALVEGSWNGSDIFYTDLSPNLMFCSDRVFDLARLHKWTNFAFRNLEDAHKYGQKPINYLR